MHLVGPLDLVGEALGVFQELGRARVDLRRRDEAAHEIAVRAVPPRVEIHRSPESLPPLLLVPLPLDALAVLREPLP